MSAQIAWSQDRDERFDAAEFYEQREVAVVSGRLTVGIECEGQSTWTHEDGRLLRTAAEFRQAFPDGVIPADGEGGWSAPCNSWFAVGLPGAEEPEVLFSIGEALGAALALAGEAPAQLPEGRGDTLAGALGRRRGADGASA